MTSIQHPVLASRSLSELGLKREMKPGHTADTDYIERGYDFDTFWYDAFWCRGRITVVCPKLFGLYGIVRVGQFLLDGRKPARVRLQRHEFYDTFVITSPDRPKILQFGLNGSFVETPVNSVEQDSAPFAGKNVAVTLSRDNDLTWIEDFARYHRQVHRLEQVLFFDNASSRYGLDDIRSALQRGGIDNPVVLSAPFRYGVPTHNAKGKLRFNTAFLQTSLLNIARLRFLSSARAVLQCDVDELVWCNDGSIFDLAHKRISGLARLGVEWRYPDTQSSDRFRHSDHVRKITEDRLCRAKYCIVPTGPLGFTSWHVHTIGLLKSRGSLITPKDCGIWHCKAIASSPWRSFQKGEASNLTSAPETHRAFQNVEWAPTPAEATPGRA